MKWRLLLVTALWVFYLMSFGAWALAIKKRPMTCEDQMERLRTDLRMRTAELEVTRGQLRTAERRLELCQSAK